MLKSNSNNNYKIVDQEPSKYEIFYFDILEYNGENIIGRVMVYDAEPIIIKFTKIK